MNRPLLVHTPDGPRLIGSRSALAAVAARDEVRYAQETTRRLGQTGGDPEAGAGGGGTSAVPASLVPVQLDLQVDGLTACANPGCTRTFMQAGNGRPRRTCSARCRKRLQLDQVRPQGDQ